MFALRAWFVFAKRLINTIITERSITDITIFLDHIIVTKMTIKELSCLKLEYDTVRIRNASFSSFILKLFFGFCCMLKNLFVLLVSERRLLITFLGVDLLIIKEINLSWIILGKSHHRFNNWVQFFLFYWIILLQLRLLSQLSCIVWVISCIWLVVWHLRFYYFKIYLTTNLKFSFNTELISKLVLTQHLISIFFY